MRGQCLPSILICTAWMLLVAVPTYGDEPRQYDLKIDSEPLGQALQEFAKQSGIQIIFFSKLTDGHVAPGLAGKFTAGAALDRLLDDSKLTFRELNPKTIEIRPLAAVSYLTTTGASTSVPGEHSADHNDSAGVRLAQSDAGSEAPGVVQDSSLSSKPTQPSSNSSARETRLEEIVVTAQRREESAQHVAIAITVMSSADIESKHIETAQDLQEFVPSMAVYSLGTGRDSTSYALRGQSTTVGAAPGVVVYRNEVPLINDGACQCIGSGPGLYLDLQNLQVLNGPQGTLFGENATGGAVLVQPKKPTNQFEGYVQAGFGNYGDQEYQGVFNVPLIEDKLLLRVAAERRSRDGFTLNVVNGSHLDDRDAWAGRVTVSLLPTADFRNDLIYDHSSSKSAGTGDELTSVAPGSLVTSLYSGAFGTASILAALAQQQALGIRATANDPSDLNPYFPNVPARQFSYYDSVTDIADWNMTPNVLFKNIAAYQDVKSGGQTDVDGTAIPIISVDEGADTAALSEEAQLQGKSASEHLAWTVGGFVNYTYPVSPLFAHAIIFADTLIPKIEQAPIGTTVVHLHSHAFYAQGTYDVAGMAAALDGVHLTAGYRYTWDSFDGCQNTPPLSCAAAQSSAPTWTFGLEDQLDPATLIYVKASRGYKGGGFNFAALDPAYLTFKPEYVQDYEVGLKRDWILDRIQLRTDIDAFHTNYTDIQRTVGIFVGNVTGNVTTNTAAARIDGVEFEGTLIPGRYLELSAMYSYLNARYTGAQNGFNVNLPFFMTPEVKFSLTGTLHIPVSGDPGRLSVSATYSHTSDLFADDGDSVVLPNSTISGYGLLNLRADWHDVANRPLDLGFFMTNATNAVYRVSITDALSSLGFATSTYGEPRMYGLQLRYHW